MKNVKNFQIKLKDDTSDPNIYKHKKLDMYSPQVNSKSRLNSSNNHDLVVSQSISNKNNSSNDKVYSLSNLKKNEFSLKSKQNNSNKNDKTNLCVNNLSIT